MFKYKQWTILWSEVASIGPAMSPPSSKADPYSWATNWFEVRTKQGLNILVDPRIYGKELEDIQLEWINNIKH